MGVIFCVKCDCGILLRFRRTPLLKWLQIHLRECGEKVCIVEVKPLPPMKISAQIEDTWI